MKNSHFLSVFLILIFLVASCSEVTDEENELAKRTVNQFISLINDGDLKSAKNMWVGDTKRASGEMPFPEFASRFLNIGEYTTSNLFIQNDVYYIRISWKTPSVEKHWRFDLRKRNNAFYFIRGYQW